MPGQDHQCFGQSVARAHERLFAVTAAPQEEQALKVVTGTPLLQIRRIVRDLHDPALEYRRSRCETQWHCYLSEL
ncbi:UTRA domain-containing protein [Halomonas organivorans]